MKTRRGLIATILLLIAFSAIRGQTYSVPKRLPLEAAAKREFRKWNVTPARYPGFIPEAFYPIGWSRDGKFAYYYEPVDEACGCYFANLVIQDMRTDAVLYEFKYNQDDLMDGDGNVPPEDTIRKLWVKNEKLFSDKLREHSIVARPSVLLGKTFKANGRSYTAKAGRKFGKNPDEDWDRVDIFSISLSSPRVGSKQIYTADYTKEEYWFMLDAGVLGVIKSPFEPRAAVIAMEVMRGWEGPPHTGDIRIVGASLKAPF